MKCKKCGKNIERGQEIKVSTFPGEYFCPECNWNAVARLIQDIQMDEILEEEKNKKKIIH